MALRASRAGLMVLYFASLLLVSSFADETTTAHDAGKNMTSGGLVDADDYVPTYGPPPYGAVNRIMARGVLVTFSCLLSFLF
ncbi:unnamed protein product [Urochloa humidicola]